MIDYILSLPWLRLVLTGLLVYAAISVIGVARVKGIENDGDDRDYVPEAPTIPKRHRTLSVKDRLALRQLQAHEQEEAEAHNG